MSRLSEPYKKRLAAVGDLFSEFCRGHKCSIPVLACDARVLTDMLIRFVNHLQANRRPLWLASHAILAMQTWDRTLKGQLKAAWDEVQSWKMMQPIKSRVPINYGILLAVVSLSHVAVCTVLDPKNRAFMGRLQVRMVKDQATVDWLLWYTAGMIPCQYLWPYSRQRLV